MQQKKGIKIFVLAALLISGIQSHAQLQASNWYFGFNAGIRFDPATGAVTALSNGQVSTNEGCASISDANGQLLFYTDGTVVFDSSHQIMQNGQGLRGNPSSTQSAIIIPKPQDPDIYFIFTVDNPFGRPNSQGIHYYEVDMRLNGGLGAVTTSLSNPPNLLADSSEKLTAINHATNDEIFVTCLAGVSGGAPFNTFYSFTVGPNGVDPVPVTSTVASGTSERRGNLKFSPDGRFLVSCNMDSGTYIYDFDQNTGLVSNERLLVVNSPADHGYGVEFSPDGSLLYVTASNDAQSNQPSSHISALYQYELSPVNLSNPSIQGVVIDQRQGYRGSLQLGLDGKIYRALADTYDIGSDYLGVINNPNVAGSGCNYQHNAIALNGRMSSQGLPPFIQSFFALIQAENTCLGNTTTFEFQTDTPPDSVLWDFGDGNTSTLENPTHTYTSARIFNVTLTLTTGGAARVYRKNVQIYEVPTANPIADIANCDVGSDGSEAIDLQTLATPAILAGQSLTTFNVRFFDTQMDAMNNTNPLASPLNQTQAQQTIYARAQNRNNEECFELTSFDLFLYEQPVANPINDLEVCDDDFDGFTSFDLRSLDSSILGNQDPNTFRVSYHESQAEADAGQNPLPDNYINSTAFNQSIFVRLENQTENSCEDTRVNFELIVNPKPVALDTQAFQCDEDGTADGRTIFSLGNFDVTVADGMSQMEVTYYLNDTDAVALRNPLNKTSYTNTAALQTISARVTDPLTGCYSLSEVVLSVSASDAQNASLSLCDDDGIEDGFTLFDLNEASATVLANAPADVTVNYYETDNDALTEQNPLPQDYTNTNPFNQIIYARAESPDGNCFGIAQVDLTVYTLPNIETQDFYEYCGNDPQALTLDSGLLEGSPADYTYQWSTNETTESIGVTSGGTYTVMVTNANGCSREREIMVVISEPATVDNLEIVHAGAASSGSLSVSVSGLGDYEYRIDPDMAYQEQTTFDNIPPGFYTLYIRDINGCGITTQDFSIVGYPRFFTPNNDGFNDYWQLKGVSNVFEPNTLIYIFDRYGKLLKQISPEGPGWDGTFNGTPLPSSDYWFKATLLDGKTFAAHFTLKR